MASQNLNVGTAANANDGDTLRAAFIKVKQMFAEVYGQTYSEQGDLSGVTFEIDEDRIKATNTAVDGQVLTYDSSTGGFTWEDKFDGDITSIVAGEGLTGSSLDSGDATLNLDSSIAGSGLTYTSGVLSVDSIDTSSITDDAVTPAKTSLFADDAAATTHHILVADGTTFTNVAMSGDATMSSTGVLSLSVDAVNNSEIADNAVDRDQLANRYTDSATIPSDYDVDFATATVFTDTMDAATIAYDIENPKTGDVKTLVLTGDGTDRTISFEMSGSTGETFNKMKGSDDFVFTSGALNLVQIICVDDTANAEDFWYSNSVVAS